MKKVLIIFLFMGLILPMATFGSSQNETITGKATNAGASLTIFINAAPSLEISSPINGTYLTDKNLDLNYTALSADSVWYKIDNGENQTLNGNIEFNISNGEHTLYLYANNSHGSSFKSVTFTIDIERNTLDYMEFNGSEKGASTNFLKYPIEELNNLSGIILENSLYGKIFFNEYINISDDENLYDNIVNISKNVEISQNHIEVNSTALPNFNKSATLYLYGLTFSNPRILIDGEICPSIICTEISYSGGTLEFNVTHFTTYSAEESPSESSSSTNNGGGGSSTSEEKITLNDFEVSKKIIRAFLKQGETIRMEFNVTNLHSKSIDFSINSSENFISVTPKGITIEPGESKTIYIDFFARVDLPPNLYFGKIFVFAGEIKKEINVILEVNTPGALFDIEIKIPRQSMEVIPGDELFFLVKLTNLGEVKKADATLKYLIINFEGEKIYSEEETVAVETKASFSKEINIPKSTKEGTYIIYAQVFYGNSTASASHEFNVVRNKTEDNLYFMIFFIYLLIIFFKLKSLYEAKHKAGTTRNKNFKKRKNKK